VLSGGRLPAGRARAAAASAGLAPRGRARGESLSGGRARASRPVCGTSAV